MSKPQNRPLTPNNFTQRDFIIIIIIIYSTYIAPFLQYPKALNNVMVKLKSSMTIKNMISNDKIIQHLECLVEQISFKSLFKHIYRW